MESAFLIGGPAFQHAIQSKDRNIHVSNQCDVLRTKLELHIGASRTWGRLTQERDF